MLCIFLMHRHILWHACVWLKAHAELQESLLQSQQQALGGLHETTNKMINQQAEAARHTAETARHIKEVS